MTGQTTGQVVGDTPLPWEAGVRPPPSPSRPGCFDMANHHGYCAALDGRPRLVPLEWRGDARLWLWGFDNGHREKLIAAALRRFDKKSHRDARLDSAPLPPPAPFPAEGVK